MFPPREFETARLFARPPKLQDAEPVFEAYGQDPDVTRYLIWEPYTDVEDLRKFFHNGIRNWVANVSYPYMLCLKGTDNPIGSIHLNIDNSSAAFGYLLSKPYWGQGLILEALSYLVDWALAQPQIYRAW
ncbi:MAG: GNAT family N-acetyltransferase, partial [Opitutaceae bacterium]|nr:GNAT family N-acetyltransferase [Opitutaceae bacterium]